MENEPTNQNETPTINTPGTPETTELPGISPSTLEAGRAALPEGVESKPQKKRGRPIIHGLYCGGKHKLPKGVKVPVASVAKGSAPVFVEESQALPVAPPETFQPEPEPFNRESEKKYTEMAINGAVMLKGFMRKMQVLRKTGDADFAALVAGKDCRSDELKEMMLESTLDVQEKYHYSFRKCPEGFLMISVGMWIVQDQQTTAQAIAEYFKQRPQQSPA
jgi:hypothetical protein